MGTGLAIYSRRTFTPEGFKKATVIVKKGRIAKVKKGRKKPKNTRFVDVGDHVLMPGVIDAHVHVNEPGRTNWEGFDTATRAAAAGGVTTIVDMPLNSSPVTVSPEAFAKKLDAARKKIHVNCGFWGGIVPENAGNLEPLLKTGVLGIKAFLVHSGIDEFPNVTKKDLSKGMPIIQKYGIPLLAHCELELDPSLSDFLEKHPQSYKAYLDSRPPEWENKAVNLMLKLCEKYNCRTHIVHLASADALLPLQFARAKGLPVTVETCSHYLYFNAENIPDGDTRYKCAPPIRDARNNEKLWEGIEHGIIDFVTTDHSPAPPEIKQLETGNLAKAWGGIAGLQFLLPALWTAAKRRNFPLEKMIPLLTSRVADFLGISHRKGAIAKGFDADLTVWDPEATFVVKGKKVMHRHKVTPYEGQKLYGKVVKTFVGGKKVYEEGTFRELNAGSLILRKQNKP